MRLGGELEMRLLEAAALTLIASAPASAQSTGNFPAIEARLRQCSAAHPDIPGSASCEQGAFVAADSILNTVYRDVMASLRHPGSTHAPSDPAVIRRLVLSERAWLGYRTAECSYRSAVAIGAPLEGFEYQQCLYALTKERVKVLGSPEAPQNAR